MVKWVAFADFPEASISDDSILRFIQFNCLRFFLGERQIRNYQTEQPDASAWRLI